MNNRYSQSRVVLRLPVAAIALIAFIAAGSTAEMPSPRSPSERTIQETDRKNSRRDVRDTAGIFDTAAVDAARKELRRIERETHVATVIQTVESLQGQKR